MTVEHLPIPAGMRLHPERGRNLNGSEIAAAAGLDPFRTPFTLWAEKAGLVQVEENGAMRRGRWLEPAFPGIIQERCPEFRRVIAPGVYLVDRERRIGATPDFLTTTRDDPGSLVNIQAKTISRTSHEKHWQDGPPIAYQLQTLWEAMLLGAERTFLAALILDAHGADFDLIEVPRHAGAEAAMLATAEKWWAMVDAGRRPAADLSRDGDTIARLHPNHTPGLHLDLNGDNRLAEILPERARLKALEADAKAQAKLIDDEIKLKLGDAESASLQGWNITWKSFEKATYTVPAHNERPLTVRKSRTA